MMEIEINDSLESLWSLQIRLSHKSMAVNLLVQTPRSQCECKLKISRSRLT